MNQLLPLFIVLPFIAFILNLFFANKKEKVIAAIAEIGTSLYILSAISFAIMWFINGYTPINQKLITLYKTDGFEFVLNFYYDHITAVYSVVGAFLFFFVARFSRYYMHRDEAFKRFFNTFLYVC